MKSYQSFSFFLNKCKQAILIFLIFQTLSCSKGSTGPAGATGPAGPSGSSGPTGTANVQYSDWFTPAAYTKDTVIGSYGFYYDKAATAITQVILDSGVVLTFGKLDGYITSIWPTNQVAQLPIAITYLNGSTGNIDTWSALATVGNLRIELISSTNAYGSISNAHQFRYVIIPGGVKLNSSGLFPSAGQTQVNSEENSRKQEVISNYSQMSYEQICTLLNIPE